MILVLLCSHVCIYVFMFFLMCDLSVVSVFFCSVLMFFAKNVSHSPTQAFGGSATEPRDATWLFQLVHTHELHWSGGTKVLHICMCMTFVFFCLHMRFLLSIVCVLCWFSEYCASRFYMNTQVKCLAAAEAVNMASAYLKVCNNGLLPTKKLVDALRFLHTAGLLNILLFASLSSYDLMVS